MKDGYYWILISGRWHIAEYESPNDWYLYGVHKPYPGNQIVEIGDYIETPEKYKVK